MTDARVRTFVSRFVRRLPALLLAAIIRGVMVTCTLLLMAPTSIFVTEAQLLEGAPYGRALARSRALARNRVGFCLGIWLATLFLPVLGAMSMDLLFNAVTEYVIVAEAPAASAPDHDNVGSLKDTVPALAEASSL